MAVRTLYSVQYVDVTMCAHQCQIRVRNVSMQIYARGELCTDVLHLGISETLWDTQTTPFESVRPTSASLLIDIHKQTVKSVEYNYAHNNVSRQRAMFSCQRDGMANICR